MTGQSAVRNTGVLTSLQGIIVERQRLLIREANYPRTIVGLAPVRGEDATPGGLPTCTAVTACRVFSFFNHEVE